jgi:hypothetical protein
MDEKLNSRELLACPGKEEEKIYLQSIEDFANINNIEKHNVD